MSRIEMIEQLAKQGIKIHPVNVHEEKPEDENSIYYLSTEELENLIENEKFDQVAAEELKLYSDNTYQVYKAYYLPICANLEKKLAKGIFDKEKAVKAFMYLVDFAAKQYHKEFCSSGITWYQVFDKATRQHVAREYANDFLADRE